MFIDEVKIKVISGKWGDGLVSWRREKYIPKGGPRGGDAGNGWNVYLETDVNLNTLSEYRHKKILKAQKGEGGWTQLMHGANGEDLVLKVPVGTIVKDQNTWEIMADLDEENTRLLVAKWGKWGFWNAHFCSSTRQAPAFAEIWDISEERDLHLELKLVADIGIIGVPSAGKSTLIWNVTNVKPKIGDYPFTTLTPNLGVLDHKWKSLVLEDVPGLIPGASQGKGLGIEFLKHIERTGVLLHLLDMYRMDQVFTDYENIRKELEFFSADLAKKEEIVVFSKADLLDDEMKDFIVSEFKNKFNKENIFIISAATGEGIPELIDFLIDNYSREKIIKQEWYVEEVNEIKYYDLKEVKDPKKVDITYLGDLVFEAKGERLEQIVRMSDFTNLEAVMRVYDVLEKMQVMKVLQEKLELILKAEDRDNSFFFEGNDEEMVSPKVMIAGKAVPLDRLKYDL
jgi:GTP-binding protein